MAYATREDMEKRFGEIELIQLTDKKGMGGFNEETFAQAQLDGDADIDVRIQAQYQLPLENVPTVLVRLACDIYRYYLYGSNVTEQVENRYNAAIKVLDQVRDGKLKLNPDPEQQPAAVETSVHVAAATPVFTDERLRNF